MERPRVVFACCHEPSGKDIELLLIELLGSETKTLPAPKELMKNIVAYDLTLDTKYYTAEVLLCLVKYEELIGDEHFAEAVDAVILYFDGKGVSEVQLWDSCLNLWNVETKILVCDRVDNSQLISWSIERDFEVVELNPSAESREELESYGECFGVDRILQILKARSWSNAEMKDDVDATNIARLKKYLEDGGGGDAMEELAKQFSEHKVSNNEEGGSALDGQIYADVFGENSNFNKEMDDLVFKTANSGHDPAAVSFEELFSQFEAMKNRAKVMPETERKAYAEKVTLAFWKAIGGDEEEVLGLSDSDSEHNA